MAFCYDNYNYHRYWRERKYEDLSEKIALKKLIRDIPVKNNLIDIGGGFGRLSLSYLKNFKHCLIIDPSKKLLQLAKKNLKKFENIEFKSGKVQEIPVSGGLFDVALMVRVSHHLASLDTAIKETKRVLKPNGYLLLEFANKIHVKSVLRALIKKNFYFLVSHHPENISSEKSVPFFNYHPSHVRTLLMANGFRVVKTLSVSNFRSPIFKKIIPLNILLTLESFSQTLLAPIFFGPSIIISAQKR